MGLDRPCVLSPEGIKKGSLFVSRWGLGGGWDNGVDGWYLLSII